MNIKKRSLTKVESEFFRRLIKEEPNITGYTTDEILGFKHVLVAEVDSRAVGFAALFDVGSWRDLAVFYVHPSYQGQGIGSKLFAVAISEARSDGQNVYTVTRTPQTAHLIDKYGFSWTEHRHLPIEIKLSNLRLRLGWYRIKERLRKKIDQGAPFRDAVLRVSE